MTVPFFQPEASTADLWSHGTLCKFKTLVGNTSQAQVSLSVSSGMQCVSLVVVVMMWGMVGCMRVVSILPLPSHHHMLVEGPYLSVILSKCLNIG